MIGAAQPAGAKGRVSSGKDRQSNEDVNQARRILGGLDVRFEDLPALAKRLKTARYFSDARQLLSRLRRLPEAAPRRVYWAQQHALCTYKDQDLPYLERADRALEILGEVENLNETRDPETREFSLPFGDWVNQVRDARNGYATDHNLPVRGGAFNWLDSTTLHSQAINREL